MPLTRGLSAADGNFASIAELQDADLKASPPTTVIVNDGVNIQFYRISAIDSGSSVNLNNGLFANTVGQNKVKSKDVANPYELTSADSGYILKFNDASTGVLNIPDGLDYSDEEGGVSVMALNLGGGDVQAVNTGAETTRGATTLGDVDGYLALTKITSIIWQSSER